MSKREQLLFTYTTALENGDFETVSRILSLAESDPVLERQLLEINEALADEMPLVYTPTISTNHNRTSEDTPMNISLPLHQEAPEQRLSLPLTLIAVAVITLLFAGVIFLQNQNTSSPMAFGSTTPEILQTDETLTVEEQHLATVQAVVDEIWNAGDYTNLANYYADPFTIVMPMDGEALEWTMADIQDSVDEFRYAFDNLVLTPTLLTTNGDTVIMEYTATGTHTGLMYLENGRLNPTGEEITWTGVFIYEFVDGIIVEERNYWAFDEFTRAFYGAE